MGNSALVVEGLSKEYKLSALKNRHDTLRDHLAHGLTALMRRNGPPTRGDSFWALKNVSFEVKRGDVVGVIGANGAGKSTLLKILSRITEPTSGSAAIHGRVASLLEVGTGFQPELSGRENIYLSGAILGMRKADIERRFDEIVDFSGIERFIDTPVKRYSSGMYVRLAFAVAAHLEPEIMLVDEVLAVGDAAFQKKCLGKMKDVVSEGRTVLFVSHNMQAVSTLTQRCLMLQEGQCISQGRTAEVISEYLRHGRDTALVYSAMPSPSEPRVTRVELRTSLPGNVHRNGEPMEVHFEIRAPGPIDGAALSFQARNTFQQHVLHVWTFDSDLPMCREAGLFHLVCRLPKARLYMGRYSLVVHFSERAGGRKFETIEDICPFEVVMYGRHREFDWVPGTCTYLEENEWQIERKESVEESFAQTVRG